MSVSERMKEYYRRLSEEEKLIRIQHIREGVRRYSGSLTAEERSAIYGKQRGKTSTKKGKSWDEFYGKRKADEIRARLSKTQQQKIPEGTVRLHRGSDGYYSVKHDGMWVPLHRYVWELYNEPVPEGFEVHHINKNLKCNCIANLEMLSHRDHCIEHEKQGRKRKRVEAATLAKQKKVRCIETGIVYDSMKEAGEKTGASQVSAVILGHQKTSNHLHFELAS